MIQLQRKRRVKKGPFHKIKRELVLSELRNDILSGKLREGQRLQQDELAVRFNVSRMPVREALMTLHAEGLVALQPHKGAVVSNLSAEDVQELLEARSLVEGLVARYAAENITDDDLPGLRDLAAKVEKVMDNPSEYFQRNLEFHNAIKNLSGKPRLVEITNYLRASAEHYMRIATSFQELRERAQPEHCELLDALEHKDADRCEMVMRKHLLLGAEILAPYFRQLSLP